MGKMLHLWEEFACIRSVLILGFCACYMLMVERLQGDANFVRRAIILLDFWKDFRGDLKSNQKWDNGQQELPHWGPSRKPEDVFHKTTPTALST